MTIKPIDTKKKCYGFGKICKNIATSQTTKGAEAEKSGGLKQNWGYYCSECYRAGLDMENEAMYG